MKRTIGIGIAALALLSCGRETVDAELKGVGVGMNPEEIGPAPTAYGGVIEYNHVEFGGGGLPLALMGLSGLTEVGPDLISFQPPYSAILGFSYMFDEMLPAADTFTFVVPVPPTADDHCYTQFEPVGPIGSFTTVDVGDYMEFRDASDGSSVLKLGRYPGDYPPDPQDLFVYYIGLESFVPGVREHLVPSDAAPDDPLAMESVSYRSNNFPFGQDVSLNFPGGFTQFDQPVSSIPRPSSSVPENILTLPEEMGDVLLSWNGPKYSWDRAVGEWARADVEQQSSCFEFYRAPDEMPLSPEDCATPASLPSGELDYNTFKGQMYTGPWETDGGVNLQWDVGESDDDLVLSVRFLAEFDYTDPGFSYPAVQESNGEYRRAQICEEGAENTEFLFDEDRYTENGKISATLQGDPSSRMAEVTCRLKNDGDFTLTEEMLESAMAFSQPRGVGGVVFYLARGTEAEAVVPAAKDQYDQRHDISPVRLAGKSIRIGRFWWPTGGE
jgi:hypothetical protein